MTEQVFSNAKPILLGSDTHAASLSGDVIADLIRNMSFPAPLFAGSCSGGQTSFQTIGSTALTISQVKNEVFIQGQARFNLSSSNSMDVRIIRDNDTGDVIASLNTGITTSGTWILSTTILNETVGAHSYQWQIKNDNNPGETSCVFNTAFFNLIAEANDTHAAVLTGDNTQRTHEMEIIP